MNLLRSLFGYQDRLDHSKLKNLSMEELEQLVKEKRKALLKEYEFKEEPLEIKDGIVGLRNLGNTCFMNSVLQCLSNTQLLTEFILKEKWQGSINSISIAAEGKMACEYYVFLKEMWKENASSYISPRNIKSTIVGVTKTFAGYSQQDAQEFLSYFLDALHEDLNQVHRKPYKEQEDYKGQDLNKFSQQFWDDYKQRNRSKIVDIFHGQDYSRITCPDCQYQSITFDPFDMINLEMPKKEYMTFEGYLISYTHDRDTRSMRGKLQNNMSALDLLDHITRTFNTELSMNECKMIQDTLVPRFLHRSKIAKDLEDKTIATVYDIMEDKFIFFVFENYSHLYSPMIFGEGAKEIWEQLSTGEIKHTMRLNILYNDNNIGLEREYVMPSKYSLRQLYLFIFIIYRKKLYNAGLTNSEGFSEGYNNENIAKEFDALFLDKKEEELPFTLMIDETKVVLSELQKDYEFTNKINVEVRLNEDLYVKQPKCKSASGMKIPDANTGKKHQDIYGCLDHYIQEEKLDKMNTWYCSKCKDHKEAFKVMKLMRLPKILIIHLKRFRKTHHRYGISISKNTDFISYPSELDMKRYMVNKDTENTKYDLYGVINHYGGVGGGHYKAMCQNFLDDKWYEFDDSRVSKVTQEDIWSENAYVLFYKMKS